MDATTLLDGDMASNGASIEVQEVNLVNSSDGTITDNNDGTWTFTPANGVTGNVALTYLVTTSGSDLFFPDNGHFYEFVSDPDISWTDAKADAEAKFLNGQQGYLVTITSQAEQDFVNTKLNGFGWTGGRELPDTNSDKWYWVTGPEGANGGTLFDDRTVSGTEGYTNWRAAEPNDNYFGIQEEFVHLRADGKWNDYPGVVVPQGIEGIDGYVVEYGEVDCVPNFTATGNIMINVLDDGAIDLTINGGGSNTVSWENSANPGVEISTNEDLTGLDAGTYNVTVSDGSCDVTASYVVGLTDNNPCCDIAITSVTPTDETCVGEDDGMLTVTASCTTCTTIEYSTDSTTWSTSNVLMGLADGTYTVYVRDSGDAECNASNSANNVIAEGVPPSTWYIDEDGDGFGASSVVDCNRPTDGLLFSELDPLSNGTDDCNDQDANVNFNQTEIAGNGVDDNCNGAIDEVPTATWVALPNGTSTGGNGTCVSATDCCTQTFCCSYEFFWCQRNTCDNC